MEVGRVRELVTGADARRSDKLPDGHPTSGRRPEAENCRTPTVGDTTRAQGPDPPSGDKNAADYAALSPEG
ncbi:hypothetical protein GCM10010988_28840 [Cnuibacter physcomitrellae]|nr:hypothetical protein GCM10010988_28840 [Cnuibacter physcomitrellae]